VQLQAPAGVAALPLWRWRGALPGVPPEPEHPVSLEPVAGAAMHWRLGNGLLAAELGPQGVVQLWGPDGRPQLAAPLQWCRWRDQGEFWDAWDIAANYREHPLPLQWEPGPELVEQGPLCTCLVWRGRCGASALRLAVQLRAASPWLELTLSVDWRQRHELLRLELPLAQRAVRWAADTSGGVLERPAEPTTERERARWELPAISWLAAQAQDPAGGGLAVLLDGPQGVSARSDRLGVSLLRAPTWPDPGADQGWQRLRLALLPCALGWCQAAVPLQARRFREPVWLRPASSETGNNALSMPDGGAPALPSPTWPALSLGSDALDLLGLEVAEADGEAWLTLQNLSPSRQLLQLPSAWQLLEGEAVVGPWQLRRVRISRRDRRTGP
jgi:alpha-mannosidase